MSTYANSSVTCYKNFLNVNKYSVMRKNVIVYHLTTMNDYKIRFIKTFDKIVNSGLIDALSVIYVSVNGKLDEYDNYIMNSYSKIILVYLNDDSTIFPSENRTINFLRTISKKHTNYLYLHCKGITNKKSQSQSINDWIDYMEYFLIEKWKICLSHLITNYMTCGVNMNLQSFPHYSGNFWWAKGEFLLSLFPITNVNGSRMQAEEWIGSGAHGLTSVNLNMFSSKHNHYRTKFPRKEYTVLPQINKSNYILNIDFTGKLYYNQISSAMCNNKSIVNNILLDYCGKLKHQLIFIDGNNIYSIYDHQKIKCNHKKKYIKIS